MLCSLFFTNNFCLDLDHHSHHKIHIVQCKEHEGLQLWHPSPCTREPTPVTTPQTIKHVATGTHLDLRGDDRRSVVCFRADHKEPNQQWTCIPSGQNGCAIQSGARSFSGEPLYLTVEGIAQEGAAIVATPYPVSWDVRRQMTDTTKTTFRFYWPGTNFVMVGQVVRSSPDIQGTPV
ncbi:hypothetical protein C2E23DRAFT_850234 [Lenzites betulinus]|nr:hypothetical protein C2E23DRAFT_850234 [Lenzites betulinus]